MSSTNPTFSRDQVTNILTQEYGFQREGIELHLLPSYNDQNFKVTQNNKIYVMKIYNQGKEIDLDQDLLNLDLQSNTMNHLISKLVDGDIPKIFVNAKGENYSKVEGHFVRLLSYIPGEIIASFRPYSEDLAFSWGSFMGKTDLALQGFDHEGAHRYYVWDLKNSPKEYVKYVQPDKLPTINYFINLFDDILPILKKQRESVIHGDGNEQNILSDGKKATGILDFGDVIYSYTVCNVAIAAAYAIIGCDIQNVVNIAANVIAGYHSAFPLTISEIRLIYVLMSMRLVTSITMSSYTMHLVPENKEYLTVSAGPAWPVLTYLKEKVTFDEVTNAILKACKISTPEDIVQFRREHFGKNYSISYKKNPLKIIRGFKQYLYDYEGKQYLDGVNNPCHVGHSHPEITEAAAKQMNILCTNTRYLCDELVDYVKALLDKFPPPLEVCYLVCTGSEANELALRLARTHTKRKDIIVMDYAYHGNTSGLVDISPYKFKRNGGFPCPDFVHVVEAPDGYRGKYLYSDPEHGPKYAKMVKNVVDKNEGKIAAYICESALGCAGQVFLPPGYLQHAYKYVRESGGVCIADEVQVGFGRFGDTFWGYESQGVVPDIVTLGKPIGNGHPIGAVITTKEIANSFANGMEYFNTFGGNNVSCVIGKKVLEIIEKEKLQENALTIGNYLLDSLKTLQETYQLIGDVRGKGLFIGVELVTSRETKNPATKEADYIINHMQQKSQVLLSTDGPYDNILKLKPPLCWNIKDAQKFILALNDALIDLGKGESF